LGQPTDIVIKKRGCGLVALNDIRRSLFHNEAGSLPFVILISLEKKLFCNTVGFKKKRELAEKVLIDFIKFL
jgi:hypothetical protein